VKSFSQKSIFPKTCIFCGGGPLTKEHVLSAWLGPLIRTPMVNYSSIDAQIAASGVTSKPSKRSGHPASRRVKCVCGACNNGWMSGIVEAVKPILGRLVKGETCRLMPSDQAKLAAWIATSVIVSEFENQANVTIPASHRDWLWKQHNAPPEWKIWIGDFERRNWPAHWIHHSLSVTSLDEPPPKKVDEGPPNTQTTTYSVGRLFVHALSSGVAGGALNFQFQGRDLMVLRRLWPANTFSLKWPSPVMNDRDADRIAGALLQLSLRVVGLPPTKVLLPDL
jgi:hypothetical protein